MIKYIQGSKRVPNTKHTKERYSMAVKVAIAQRRWEWLQRARGYTVIGSLTFKN
jgi:hypothetical protein